jgi:hypothetical protein
MVPAAVVDTTIADLLPHLEAADIVIDGGNSYYVDDIRRAKELAPKSIHYVDVGTSGVWGLERGYCMMIGGDPGVVNHLDPIFATLAPGIGDIPRTPGRDRAGGTAEQGYLHCGPHGAGHFVKFEAWLTKPQRVWEPHGPFPGQEALMVWIPAIALTVLAILSAPGGAVFVAAQVGGPPAEPPVLIKWPSRGYPTLQAAIDALADGGKLIIAPGVFEVPSPLHIQSKQIAIEGAGCDELPKGKAPKRVTQLVGPRPGHVAEFESVVGLFNYQDAGGRLRGLKLSGFDAGIRARDGAAAALRGRSLVIEETCISDTGRGIAWSASSALQLENVAIRRVFWNGISATTAALSFAPHSAFDLLVQDAANACVAYQRQIAYVSGVFGGCGVGGGISAESSALLIRNALILNSAGPGLNVTGEFSWTNIADSTISDTTVAGIVLQDPFSAVINNTKIFDTFASNGSWGDGILIVGTHPPDSPHLVAVTNTFVGNSARKGLFNYGGKVSVATSTFQCGSSGAAGQFEFGDAAFGHTPVWTNAGGNLCGCPLANSACIIDGGLSLAPPPLPGPEM